jgi:hypothetical protein
MTIYAETLTMREARDLYFAASGFDESSYSDRWVKLQAGPIPLYFPNTKARIAAVRFHDLHHVVTGYDTTWTGEAEIGAWEIASGCAHHYAAWQLNLQAMAIGLLLNPVAVFRAFLRGRRSKNLYREEFGDTLLSPTIGELRRRLRLDVPLSPSTISDRLAFAAWALASMVTFLLSVGVALAPFAVLFAVLLS